MSASQRISAARVALSDALANEDWDAIGALDLECRTCVEKVLSEPELDQQKVREDLEALLGIYRKLVVNVTEARQAIAKEMSDYKKSTSAAKVYKLFR